ncbi:uncharacterized protein [Halyomorpha halys]|uniref:uncharacterized protein n=1 Tax=Halyomorpha halys TaxID=286706 RepID=UPI0034D382BE
MLNSAGINHSHITGGCGVFAGTEYLQRHNHVARILHQALAIKYHLIEVKSPDYKYQANRLLQKHPLKLYWDESIITDHTVRHNKPYILLIDLTKKKTELMYVGIPNDNNISSTVGEKLRKYQELAIELKELYHLEGVTATPIIIFTNGLVPKSTVAGVNALGVPVDVLREAQQSVLLARIVRKVLSI